MKMTHVINKAMNKKSISIKEMLIAFWMVFFMSMAIASGFRVVDFFYPQSPKFKVNLILSDNKIRVEEMEPN